MVDLKDEDDGIPAWMMCSELLIRLKDEFTLEATEVLEREIKAGRLRFTGKLITLPESAGNMERDIYIINHLLHDENEIRHRYAKYMVESTKGAIEDAKVIERVEELKRFLMALTQISMLMRYGGALGVLANECGRFAGKSDAAEVLVLAVGGREETVEAIAFALDSGTVKREAVLTEDERQILRHAIL